LHPLQRRLPLGALSAFTFGEALALAASTVFLLGSMWWLNDGAGSGKLARVPILFAFLTASKHSLFSFALGLPFERALFWHKLAAAWGVALGAWHGYIAFEADAARSGPPVLSVALGALRSYFALLADDGTLLAGGMLRAAPSGMLLSGWWVFGGEPRRPGAHARGARLRCALSHRAAAPQQPSIRAPRRVRGRVYLGC
jgi:hypothetical protein